MSSVLSVIHYKFKTDKTWATIQFEAIVISVLDLKRAIIAQKKITKSGDDFDLFISNAQTGEEYRQDGYLIPKNTSVNVKRIPATRAATIQLYDTDAITAGVKLDDASDVTPSGPGGTDAFGGSVFTSAPAPDAQPIDADQAAMMAVLGQAQSAMPNRLNNFGAPVVFNRGGGRQELARTQYAQPSVNDRPPPNYVCHRCGTQGHFIQHCPTNNDPEWEKKKNLLNRTGIPGRHFLQPIMDPKEQALQQQQQQQMMGQPMVGQQLPLMNGSVRRGGSREQSWSALNTNIPFNVGGVVSTPNTPVGGGGTKRKFGDIDNNIDKLICPLCKDLFKNAVVSPCCYLSYCEGCIKQALMSDDQSTCPSCREANVNPNELKPNSKIQALVDEHKLKHGIGTKQPRLGQPQYCDNCGSTSHVTQYCNVAVNNFAGQGRGSIPTGMPGQMPVQNRPNTSMTSAMNANSRMTSGTFIPATDDWICPNPQCANVNFFQRLQCNRCKTPKPAHLAAPAPFIPPSLPFNNGPSIPFNNGFQGGMQGRTPVTAAKPHAGAPGHGMCKNWGRPNACSYGERCQFAHVPELHQFNGNPRSMVPEKMWADLRERQNHIIQSFQQGGNWLQLYENRNNYGPRAAQNRPPMSMSGQPVNVGPMGVNPSVIPVQGFVSNSPSVSGGPPHPIMSSLPPAPTTTTSTDAVIIPMKPLQGQPESTNIVPVSSSTAAQSQLQSPQAATAPATAPVHRRRNRSTSRSRSRSPVRFQPVGAVSR